MKILVAILLLMFTSCNPAKRLARQQQQYKQLVDEYNKNHPQRYDTATKFFPAPDSSRYFKAALDSIQAKKLKHDTLLVSIYKDTCKSAVDEYNNGFDFGYIVGSNSAKMNIVHDTFETTIYPVDEINNLSNRINSLEKENYELEISKTKQEKKKISWMLAFVIATSTALLLLFALLRKKFSL